MCFSGQCRVIIDPTMHPNQYPTHYPIMDEDESLEKWVYQTFYLKMSPQDGIFSVLLPYRSGIQLSTVIWISCILKANISFHDVKKAKISSDPYLNFLLPIMRFCRLKMSCEEYVPPQIPRRRRNKGYVVRGYDICLIGNNNMIGKMTVIGRIHLIWQGNFLNVLRF